ncbi:MULTISPECIES: alpha/beta hydrolase [unclassified Marinobacter]|uniref:alpha/beta hydrolase n=1 Tax=unclassified Marinobacter TaxID=83889 RepID=UPI0026E20A6B|nr:MULTISPECIES: alpha/beta hydrolase [unclassified Marinobacter]MDO6441298.1 alpha/beta hydrolase [Marinobacter sp. 2_MG-2023]MDO6822523.1 alpha/beta hydrolase [Marinobacter sp. 1_MG-2023]
MKASHIRKLIKPINSAYSEMFSGRVYRVGEGAVSVRNHSGSAKQTVIGVHGFLENHCYFTQTYDAPTTELILLTCSNYHIPVNGVTPETPTWEVPIKHLEGTIEYDACILNQALTNLPSTRNIRIHGHSRGGAVVLEAIKHRPELYEDIEVILEAPALPKGKIHPLVTALLEPVSHGMWPWLIRLINSAPSSAYGQTFFGKMNPRKKQLLSKLFYSTRDHLTIVRNIENILEWMERTDTGIYQNVRHGTFLIPGVDRILDRPAMLASARQSPTTMRIIETQAPSHFVTLDSKEWLPGFESLPAAAQN